MIQAHAPRHDARRRPGIHPLTFLLLGLASAATSPGATEADALSGGPPTGFPGTSSVGGQLHSDHKQENRFLDPDSRPWRGIAGLSLSADYNALWQGSTDGLGSTSAGGGVFRVYGNYRPFGEAGEDGFDLTFKFENRHKLLNATVPQDLGANLGTSSLTGITWSDAGTLMSNFYIRGQWFDNRLAVLAGWLDVTDYVDVYGLENPWTDFMNSLFGNSPTIAAPGQGFGMAVRWSFTPNYYLIAGLADAQGDPTEPVDSVSNFFTDGRYFKHLEFGWISSWKERSRDNIHLTLWQSDGTGKPGDSDGWGAAVSVNRILDEHWLPFIRVGWSDGGAGAPQKLSAAAGLGRYFRGEKDLAALAVHYGRPSDRARNLDHLAEWTIEMLYRHQLSNGLTISPDIQLLFRPVSNPTNDFIAVFGLRTRLVF